MIKNWFMQDRKANIIEYFKTVKEAVNYAKWYMLQHYYDGNGWYSDVEGITVGKVTHGVEMIDRHDDPTGEYDYLCSYHLKERS